MGSSEEVTDGRRETLFLSLGPGVQVSLSDGEGSGKHLYLKSTLSTEALSDKASSRSGIGGKQPALSTHTDIEGASSTHSLAVGLELFMVIVLSAFLFVPQEAGAQGGRPSFSESKVFSIDQQE